MGMGIIMSAMSAGGNAVADAATQAQKVNDEQALMAQRSALEAQNAKGLIDYKNAADIAQANTVRDALATRLAPTQSDIQGIIARNANQKFDYTNDDGSVSPATYDELPDEDANNPALQPSGKQLIGLQIQKALASGDPATAAELTKIDDAGKVTSGYGGTVIDQNDIDPDTGQPRVLISSALDRTAVGQSNADARMANARAHQTAADAARARAASPGGAYDKTLTSLNQSIKSQTSIMNQAQNAAMGATPKDRPALQARVDQAAATIRDLEAQASARRAQLAQPGAAQSSSATPSSGVDYSNLWTN